MSVFNEHAKNNIFLAPMAGITDLAMRSICQSLGAGLTYTEMVSANGLAYKNEKTLNLLKTNSKCAVQIFGKEVKTLALAVKYICDNYVDFVLIDLNMGCPAPKIVKNFEGCALMNDVVLASKIIESVVKISRLPVTVKFRSGFDENNINAVEFAKMCEQSGACAVTVHGRTRSQFYSGKADLDIIASVKQSVAIPVIANGDIVDASSAVNMLNYTHADAVMIGRGAIGNPFIFEEILCALNSKPYSPPDISKKIATALLQLELSVKNKGEYLAVREFRMQVTHYLRGIKNAALTRQQLMSAKTFNEVKYILNSILHSL